MHAWNISKRKLKLKFGSKKLLLMKKKFKEENERMEKFFKEMRETLGYLE
jgi:hypothetical protein